MAQDALYLWTRGFSNLEAMHIFLKRYWPRHTCTCINGDAIRTGVASLELGKCVAMCNLASKLGSQPVPFFVACLRDSNHVVLAMSTAGTINPTGKYVPRGSSQGFNHIQVIQFY